MERLEPLLLSRRPQPCQSLWQSSETPSQAASLPALHSPVEISRVRASSIRNSNPELGAKKIELLKEALPHMTRAACLLNPDNPHSISLTLQAMEDAAKSLKMELHQFAVRRPDELESAFERMEQARIEGLAIDDEGMLNANVGAIARLAVKRRLLSSGTKEFAQAGGLIGYGVNHFATFRRAAVFVDKILKGIKPADLPIEQATTFEFVLNLKTANALGLTVPLTLLVRADEVIE